MREQERGRCAGVDADDRGGVHVQGVEQPFGVGGEGVGVVAVGGAGGGAEAAQVWGDDPVLVGQRAA